MIRRDPRPRVKKLQAQRSDDDDPVGEPDQVQDVDRQPQDPGREAALAAERPEPRDVGHAGQPADHGHVAPVAVAERAARSRPTAEPGLAAPRNGHPGCRPGPRPARAGPCVQGWTAASPTAKISGWPGTVRSGSTMIRPFRSVGAPVASATAPTKLEARIPAAHSTVRAGITSGGSRRAARP